MKTLHRITLIAAGICAVALATADATKDFKSYYMSKIVPGMKRAMLKGDTSFFEKLMTSDYTSSDYGRKPTDKATSISMLKQSFGVIHSIQATMGAATFKADKSKATVAASWTYVGSTVKDPKGKSHKITILSKNKETWVKKGSDWLIQSSADLGPPKMTMDGKAMQGAGG